MPKDSLLRISERPDRLKDLELRPTTAEMDELTLYSDQALAQRSRSSTATYPIMAALFVGASASNVSWIFLFLVLGIYRYWLCARFMAGLTASDHRSWKRQFSLALFCNVAAWLALTFSPGQAHMLETATFTAGMAAGGVNSLSSDRKLSQAFLSSLLLPFALWSLLQGLPYVSAASILYWLALMGQVKANHQFFQSALRDNLNLRQQAQELKVARHLAEESARQAVAADQAKGAFLTTISHEIRTPLNGVIGMTGLLLDTPLHCEQREFAQTIRKSGEALLSLLNDILDFSKLEAHKVELEMVPFKLRQVSEDVLDLVLHSAQEKGLELKFECPDNLPTRLIGDPGRFRQVLLNLLTNAIKFTDSGMVSLRLEHAPADQAGTQQVRCTVRDSGCGIASEACGKLFRPFTQADNSTTRRYGGTGLGLAICQKLVQAMGGEISLDSVLGQGTTLSFTACFRVDGSEERTEIETPPLSLAPRGGRILVVEDNRVNQHVATRLLEKAGYCCDVAANGLEALEALQAIPYDCVLMDCQMPVLDGYEATRQLRAARGINANVLVVAATAGVTTEERKLCQEAGMDDFIAKPIQAQKLLELLARRMPEAREQSPTAPLSRSILVQEAQKLAEQVEQMLAAGQTAQVAEILGELERVHAQLHLSFAA